MKRILSGLLALCLLWSLPVTAAARSRTPTLACRDDGDSILLTLENLEDKVYAIQAELTFRGEYPDASFQCDISGAYSPDCHVKISGKNTIVTVYICAGEGVLNDGRTLRLGSLDAGKSCGLPERADLILLDQNLNALESGGRADITSIGDRKDAYRVRVLTAKNGEAEARPTSAEEGETVTVTVTPDEGYTLDRLTAKDSRNRELTLTAAGTRRYTFVMPGSDVELEAVFIPGEDETPLPFTDISPSDWCYDAVRYVYQKGLMNGTSTTTFTPNNTTTRGMIVAILYRLEGSPDAGLSNFTDVLPTAYYASAVAWASANGIVNGYSDGTFRPNNPITREQMAAFLYRYAGYKGRDISARADLNGYLDAAQIAGYAVEPIQWANAQGLINGTSSTTLSPAGNATRAQVAVILTRFAQNVVQ